MKWSLQFQAFVLAFAATLLPGRLLADHARITPGNILVTHELLYADSLDEYTPTGQFVQTFAVPGLASPPSILSSIDDIAADSAGNIYLTRADEMLTYSSATDSWSSFYFPVKRFALDQNRFVSGSSVVFSTDLTGNTPLVFSGPSVNFADINVGQDGLTYALSPGNVSPSGSHIDVYDTASGNYLHGFDLPPDYSFIGPGGSTRSIAANAAGEIFLGTYGQFVARVNPDGTIADSTSFPFSGGNGHGLEIGADGTLLIADTGGSIVLMTQALDVIRIFPTGGGPSANSLATFVPTPEPNGAILAMLGFLVAVIAVKLRTGQPSIR